MIYSKKRVFIDKYNKLKFTFIQSLQCKINQSNRDSIEIEIRF